MSRLFSLIAVVLAGVLITLIVAVAQYNISTETMRDTQGHVDCGYLGSNDSQVLSCDGPACAIAKDVCGVHPGSRSYE